MAQRHDELLAAGTRVFGVSVDSPAQQAAMVQKLRLPFPLLSDPGRSGMIEPLGVADPHDDRGIARPASILFRPDGEEAWRHVSRDFADRIPEDELVEQARALGLPEARQDPPETTEPEPGPKAMTVEQLPVYFRGARFAAMAMGLRHGHRGDEIKEDSKAYVAEMDRFSAALQERLG